MTEWHAVASLDEALNRMKGLLFPINVRFWLTMGLIVLLAGGISSSGGDRMFSDVGDSSESPAMTPMIVVVFAAILFFGLVFMYVSAVFEYVFVDSLSKGRLRIVEGFKEYAGMGLSLFLIELTLVAFMIIAAVAVIVPIVAAIASESLAAMLVTMGVGIVVGAIIIIVLAILMWLLRDLAVPISYSRGIGVFKAFKEALGLCRSGFWQVAVYALLKIVLGMAAAMVTFVVALPLFLAVLAIGAVLGIGAYVGLAAFSGADLTPAIGPAIFAIILALVIVQFAITYVVSVVTLPISVFLRYFSLVFLQRIDPTIKLLQPVKMKEDKPDEAQEKVKVY